jgi:hypothetical protein
MSAFLKFSQKRRSTVKERNPDMSNTDVSRLLGEMWRSADQSERAPYVEHEEIERAQYKEEIKNWRNAQAKLDASNRTSHTSVQHNNEKPPPPPPPRKPRDDDSVMLPQLASAHPHDAPVERVIDRRIFRSYSGSSHPAENKYYTNDPHRAYRTLHPPSGTGRAHAISSDKHTHRPYKSIDPLSYNPAQAERSTAGSPNMMHHHSHPVRLQSHTYRSVSQPSQYPRENLPIGQLRFTESDISQFDAFCDPDPPFNPRQTRPSSSHYFHDRTYHYP